jgi:hypothetical protein
MKRILSDFAFGMFLAVVVYLVLSLVTGAFGTEVRPEVVPVGEYQVQPGKATDVLLPGAGVTLEPQGSNPGGSHTLFEGATGFVFYGGDGRTDQLPKRWERVVTLAGDSGEGGADYTSWTLALAAAEATTPSLIQLLPDTYTLSGQVVLGPGVSLHGAGRTLSVVTCSTSGWYTPPDARTSALIAKWGDGEIAHLTLRNQRTGYPSVCLASGYNGVGSTSGASIWIHDVVMISGSSDTLYFSGGNRIEAVNIEATCANVDTISMNPSSASAVYTLRNSRVETQGVRGNGIYMATAGTFYSYENEYWNANGADSGAFWFVTANNGAIYSIGDKFYDGATKGTLGDIINGVGSGTGWNLYVRNASASGLNDPEIANLTVDADEQSFGDFNVAGDLEVGGSAYVSEDFTAGSSDFFSVDLPYITMGSVGDGAVRHNAAGPPGLEFDDGGGGWSVNLYHGDPNVLVTDDAFDALSLEINGVEVIQPTRVAEFAGLTVTGLTNLNDQLTAQSETPHVIGTKDLPSGSGIDTALIVQTDFTTTPVLHDGSRILIRVDNGLQTNALALEGILGADSNEGYGRMAHYPNGVYTPFLQFGGETAPERGNVSNLVSTSTWDTAPNLKIGGVPFAVEAVSTITLNQANIVMSADPNTTFGIATRGFVLAQNPTFQTLYPESGASDVGGYKVMTNDIPTEPTQSITCWRPGSDLRRAWGSPCCRPG